jgi:GNAT superfamily N-acetyltransferase
MPRSNIEALSGNWTRVFQLRNIRWLRTIDGVDSRQARFLPAATWLIASCDGCCGTIQAYSNRTVSGAVQNLGVIPEYRGLGLGAALHKVLEWIPRCRCESACISKCRARNRPAVRLYHQVGFIACKTLYRELLFQPEEEYSI